MKKIIVINYMQQKYFVYCRVDLSQDTLEELNEFIDFNTNVYENVKLSDC